MPKAWLAVTITAAIIGGASTVVFAAWWFAEVGGHCGVVRFYEQAFGVFLVGGWFVGTAVGLLTAFLGRRGSIQAVVAGCLIAILTNLVAVSVCAKVFHDIRAADYTLKSTDELLDHLSASDLDARKLSAHALGERRAIEALGPLCVILQDPGEDIDLRHNAAIALGRIGGREARSALEKALRDVADDSLAGTIRSAIGQRGNRE